MHFKIRFWKRSIYTGKEIGPYELLLEARDEKEAVEKAIAEMFKIEARLTASIIARSEIFLRGKWKAFGPEGLEE